MSEFDLDVAILGAGTAGMSAYREARKHSGRIALIDGGPLGTTCARVGCMPSKLLIAAAEARHRAAHLAPFGILAEPTRVDGEAVMRRVREERDRFVGFVLEAIAGFDQEQLIRQNARFEDDNTLSLDDGRRLRARAIVIATGSRPNIPPPFEVAGDRLISNDDVFDWQDLPDSAAVFGAGIIGLELGQALHRLGVRVRLFGRNNGVGPLSDPEVRRHAARLFADEFPAHWDARTEVRRVGDGIVVTWSDADGSGGGDGGGEEGEGGGEERFEYLLAATGRRANVDGLGLENTSLTLDRKGVPEHDPLSMRCGDSAIFIAGDANAELPLLHEAADEGRLAGRNAARVPEVLRQPRRTPLAIMFTDPQIAIAGESHRELTERNADFACGEVSFEDQGRARVMLVNRGLLRVYGERGTDRLLGAEMIGPAAEHLSHLLAWAIESKLTVGEVLQRPFYHPVIEEGLRTALRVLEAELGFGAVPPQRCIDCGPGA